MVKTILRPFRGLIHKMGADYNQVCLVLSVKLKMDNRRNLSFSSKTKKKPKSQMLFQSFIYGILGLIMGLLFAMMKDTLVAYTMFFSFIMVMIALVMISEFSNVLLDTRDNSILLSRPISSRSLALAKVLHIAFYMLHLSFSLSLFTIGYTLVHQGYEAMLLLILLIILAALFTLFLTNIFYLGLMRLVSGQKLKDIIVYFQVAMAILIMGAYQLLPRMIDHYDLKNIHLPIHWWTYLIPSVWMGGSFESVSKGIFDGTHISFLLSALILPFLSLVIVIKYLAPHFNQSLSRLDIATTKKSQPKTQVKASGNFIDRLSAWFCSSIEERTAFKMTWIMSGRERKFKQTVYPAFGYIFIIILLPLFKSKDGFEIAKLAQSKLYLLLIYAPIFTGFTVNQNLCFTEETRSSWFYRSLPIAAPGRILRGSFKSAMIKYILPIQLLMATIGLAVWKIAIIDDLIFGAIAIVLMNSLMQSWQNPRLPFSVERDPQDIGGNFAKGILLMLSIAVLAGIHYGLSFIPYGIWIGIPLLAFLLHLQMKTFAKIGWEKIRE